MKSSAKAAIYGVFDKLLPPGQARITEGLRRRLVESPLTVVDVGAVFGPDPRWRDLGERTCRFLTFEPDARSYDSHLTDGPFEMLALPTALGGKKGERTLHLTAGSFASSLFTPNEAVLGSFGTWPWHLPAGEEKMQVDTLDACLASRPGWAPDFIKTDVEGADLEVLMGGAKALKTALGVQVEVAFVERNIGAPLFAESDIYLRNAGFTLVQLIREHWVRTNKVIGPRSRPHLIWADAIYFVDTRALHARLAAAPVAERDTVLAKFVALALVHGYHDFAEQAVQEAAAAGHCSSDLKRDLDASIKASIAHPRFFMLRAWTATLLACALWVLSMPFGSTARRQMRDLYVKQGSQLWFRLYRESMRAGLDRSCVTDLG